MFPKLSIMLLLCFNNVTVNFDLFMVLVPFVPTLFYRSNTSFNLTFIVRY